MRPVSSARRDGLAVAAIVASLAGAVIALIGAYSIEVDGVTELGRALMRVGLAILFSGVGGAVLLTRGTR